MGKYKKGIDFLIGVTDNGKTKILGGQRGCTLNRSSDTIDVTTKDSEGWQENLSGLKNWGIDTDGMIIQGDEAYDYLEECFMESKELDVYLTTPVGKKYTGKAVITDFPLEAPYDDAATYSVSFTGTGKLENNPVSEEKAKETQKSVPVEDVGGQKDE